LHQACEFFQLASQELLTWAANEIDLSVIPQGSNATLRAGLRQVSKQTGKVHEKLLLSEKQPVALIYLWEIYLQLFKFQDSVSYQEILAWSQLMQHPLDPQEIAILKHLDRLTNAR
jgi:hypothetical protein